MSTKTQELIDAVRYSPKESYKVNALVNGEWTPFPDRFHPARYRKEETARNVAEEVKRAEAVTEVLVVREDTVFFSDLQTKQVNSLTTFTGLLV